MSVMNYYALAQEELDFKINQIRNWLFDYPNDQRHQTALFALDVALCARSLRRDDFVKLCIDYIVER